MKTKLHYLLFLFSLLFLNYSYSQTTYVPDNVFEQYLIDEGYDDVLDDYVLTANINNVTAVNLNNTNVSDLTGLEDFSALRNFQIFNTPVSSIDVSSNTALEFLQVSSTSINTLDISVNTALTTLSTGNNFISSIDVSTNTSLIYLWVNVTSLSILDVSTNTALELLSVSNTSISSLDVSTNTALTNLDVYNTSISSLDVSTNTALTRLDVYNTSISSLDVSTNTVLTTFSGFGTPNLDCITVADEVAATAGTGIYTNWQKDEACSYSESCSSNTLTYVPDNVFEQYLIDEGYDDVLDDYVLTANIENITVVDLNNTNVSDLTGIEDFTALTQLYVYNTSLSSLDVSANIALTSLLTYNTSISSLDLSANTALTYLSTFNTFLSSLDVSTNTALTGLAAYNTSLSNLDVSQNTALTELYVHNTSLNSLDLSANTALTYLYVQNTSLSSLDLSANTALTYSLAFSTPNLNCITVADEAAATAGTGIYTNWQKDVNDTYSEDCDNLSISEFDISKVYIGPNPIKDELDIVLNNVAVLNNVELFDITGKLVLTSTSTHISTSHIESGVYLLKITTDKGSFTRKLVKN